MPVERPPVGPARVRPLRLAQLRARVTDPRFEVDVDSVGRAIARRAAFTSDLSARLRA